MGIFGSPTRKRKSPRAVLNALNRRIEKKKRKDDKKSDAIKVRKAIAAARKKLRGY